MERLFNTPLLITQEYGLVVTAALADRLNLEPPVARDVMQRYERPAYAVSIDKTTGVAVMPVVGAMVHRGGFMESMSGTNSYTGMQAQITELLDNNKVRGILLDIDSGGGEAAGLPELAEFIIDQNTLGDKPIWAIANSRAASAAYWLGSSAERFYIAPGASVGSIGVYVQHTDMSQALEKRGIVTSFVFAGKHKIDGNSFEPLPADVRANLQKRVDALWLDFATYVADRRNMTVEEVQGTEAQMFGAKEAVDLRLADGEGTLGEVFKAFASHLNRPHSLGFQTSGAAMTERALYTQSDVDRARADGRADGVKESQTTATAATETRVTEAVNRERTEILTALGTIIANDPRIDTFVEAMNDGSPAKTAAKYAAKIPAPVAADAGKSATDKDVDRVLKAHAPDVKGGEDQTGEVDPKVKRLAELNASTKAFNQSKGYLPRN
jgi:signal peptide peptidase SppA